MNNPSKDERALIAEVVRAKGYRNVKGIEKVNYQTFKVAATMNQGKTVYCGLIVKVLPESLNVAVDYAYS